MKNEAGVASEALVFQHSSLQERLTDPRFRGFMDEVIRDDVAFLQSIGERPADPALTPDLYRTKLERFIGDMLSHNAEVIEADGVTVIGIPINQPERNFMAQAVGIVQERRRKVEEVLGSPLPAQVVYMGSGRVMEESYRVLGEPDMEQLPSALASGRSCYVNMDVFGKYLGKERTIEALYHEAGHVILNMIIKQYTSLRGTSVALQEAFAGPFDKRLRTIDSFDTNSHLIYSSGYRSALDSRWPVGTMRQSISGLGFYGWLRGSFGSKSRFFENVSAYDFYRFCQQHWGNEVNVLRDLLRIQDPTNPNTRYQVPINLSHVERMMLPDFYDLLRTPYTAISSPSPVGTITWPRNTDQPVALCSQVGYLAGMCKFSSWLNSLGRTCSALLVEAPGRRTWNVILPQFVQGLIKSGFLGLNPEWNEAHLMEIVEQKDYLASDPFRGDAFIRLISLHPDTTTHI